MIEEGALVTWSHIWLAGCGVDDRGIYMDKIGVVICPSPDPTLHKCWTVLWSDGEVDEVHTEYLRLL